MNPGDKVRVYPEGGRAIAATGTIVAAQGIGSDRSILVALPDRPKPAFATTQFHGAVLGVWIDEVWFRLIVLVRGQASGEEIGIMRAYLLQWILHPVWSTNPHEDEEGRRTLWELRVRARKLETISEITEWLSDALDFGLDPL